jgi:hypothetical protein
MDFFKRLFGGGGARSASSSDKDGLYYYVKPNGCTEIVRVRINVNNDLSLEDDGKGYFVRKSVRGTTYKCTRTAELLLSYDSNRRLQNTEIEGGTLVTLEDYEQWLAAQETGGT